MKQRVSFLKLLIWFTALLVNTCILYAQKVGINTSNPLSTLDIRHTSDPFNQVGFGVISTGSYVESQIGVNNGSQKIIFRVWSPDGLRPDFFLRTENGNTSRTPIILKGQTGFVGINIPDGQTGSGIDYPLDIWGDVNIDNGKLRLSGNSGSSGAVLVSGGSTSNPEWRSTEGFRASLTSTPSLESGIVPIRFNTTNGSQNFNTGAYSTTTGYFTAPRSGIYQVNLAVSFEKINIGTGRLTLFLIRGAVTGSILVTHQVDDFDFDAKQININTVVRLQEGDILRPAYSTSSTTLFRLSNVQSDHHFSVVSLF